MASGLHILYSEGERQTSAARPGKPGKEKKMRTDRLTKKIAQAMLNINDNSHTGDIADLPEPINEHDDTIARLDRAGYICCAGDRYVITHKALWR